ncbi:FHA domain-containing protein [Dictyoglomus thermophilum]|uniref:Forkhead-associated protein n=2 Tax=Dictyoglomus thermophilum TaxID=14 RepID=B5YAM0_DICT6|nr:FHA domain-containing protein [Dictyoglomus thermophilum]ACI19754.1 forkhead-associated protein [Dictyoglomus thermophilum H-6-12]MCX7720546.1 FHA domain-containing protein [Dictyoglomus thermophilum]TYT24298.1 FHA domain-containing protein [Dictyoglomus thermophilum]
MSLVFYIMLALLIILVAIDIALRLKKEKKPQLRKLEKGEELISTSNTMKLDASLLPINWAYLIIKHGENRGKDFKIIKDETTIGREPENDIVIPNPTVSRFHAKITRSEDKYFIEDLGSANGTMVNGIRVTKELLHDGDIVQLGDVVLVFKCL